MRTRVLISRRVSKRAVMKWLDVPGTTNKRHNMFRECLLGIQDWLEEHHPNPLNKSSDIDPGDDDVLSLYSDDAMK